MKQIELELGMDIRAAAVKLVVAAMSEDSFMIFNGICVGANRFSTVDGVCEAYDKLSEIRQREYQESPEHQAGVRHENTKKQLLQIKADALMRILPYLNFYNLEGLLDWLCDIYDARGHIGVKVDDDLIRRIFAQYGYVPNMNVGEEFDATYANNYAKWIIGQAIQSPCHPMVLHFTREWKHKFR